MFEYNNYDNFAIVQIDSQEKLTSKIDKDFNRGLLIIPYMQKIYTKYLD